MYKLLTALFFICIAVSDSFSQNSDTHTIKVEIENNAFMCPNLGMKIKRTFIQRQDHLSNWQVAGDYSSATFSTTNSSICTKDSIIKIFVRESEYPLHIIKSIQIDNVNAYTKGSTNH